MTDAPIDQDTLLAAIRECVTVVKPGEVLAVRVPMDVTARQVHDYQEAVNDRLEFNGTGIKVLILPGEEFAVAQKHGVPPT